MKKVIPSDAVLIPKQAAKVFEGKIFDVYQWEQELFDGSQHTFEMLKRTDTVTAICIVDDKILVIDDEQPHLGSRRSFPGGRVDSEDESMEAAVQREVREETGYNFRNWRLVKVSQPYRKMEWFVYVYLAWNTSGQQPIQLDPGEKITVELLNFKQLKAEVLNRSGYLGESSNLFEGVNDLDEIMALPEFHGLTVHR